MFFKGERTAAEMPLLLTYSTCTHPFGTDHRYMHIVVWKSEVGEEREEEARVSE
jgi:hypothetical protein